MNGQPKRHAEGALSEPGQVRKAPTSNIEERLTRVSLAVEALEERLEALLEDCRGEAQSKPTI